VARYLGKLRTLDLVEELMLDRGEDEQAKKVFRLRHGDLTKAWDSAEAQARNVLKSYRKSVDHLTGAGSGRARPRQYRSVKTMAGKKKDTKKKAAPKKKAPRKGAGKKEEEEVKLIEGSEYEVQSLGSREAPFVTKGTFRGYTMVGGHAEAVCIELDKSHKRLAGKMRVIPSHMVLTIDIIKEAKEEEEEEDDSASRSYM
jgi:hypothetical protein